MVWRLAQRAGAQAPINAAAKATPDLMADKGFQRGLLFIARSFHS